MSIDTLNRSGLEMLASMAETEEAPRVCWISGCERFLTTSGIEAERAHYKRLGLTFILHGEEAVRTTEDAAR